MEHLEGLIGQPTPDPCMVVFDQTCIDILVELINEPIPDACNVVLGRTCAEVIEELDQITLPQVCEIAFGKSCEDALRDFLEQVTPDACKAVLGMTCDQAIASLTADPFCDIWFPTDPPVQRGGTVWGDAAAYCPGIPGPIILVVCMEFGATPSAATQIDCFPYYSPINRVDGWAESICLPGVWFTGATVFFGGTQFSESAHSSGLVTPCVLGPLAASYERLR